MHEAMQDQISVHVPTLVGLVERTGKQEREENEVTGKRHSPDMVIFCISLHILHFRRVSDFQFPPHDAVFWHRWNLELPEPQAASLYAGA